MRTNMLSMLYVTEQTNTSERTLFIYQYNLHLKMRISAY